MVRDKYPEQRERIRWLDKYAEQRERRMKNNFSNNKKIIRRKFANYLIKLRQMPGNEKILRNYSTSFVKAIIIIISLLKKVV